jgi:hypothetical protein
MHYPMTDQRLQAHLDFFTRNLGYAFEDGRRAVLDILQAVVTRFPQPVLDDSAAFLLLPLVVRLTQDPSAACRAAVGQLVCLLFKHASLRASQELAGLCIQWSRARERAGNRRAAFQVLGLAVEGRPDAFLSDSTLLREVLQSAAAELAHAAVAVAQAQARLRPLGESGAKGSVLEVCLPDDASGEGAEDAEADRRALARAASRRALAIERGDDDMIGPRDDGDDEEEGFAGGVGDVKVANASDVTGERQTNSVVSAPTRGIAGGGVAVFGAPLSAKTVHETVAFAKEGGASTEVGLAWEPAYFALVALEKIWRSTQLVQAAEEILSGPASAASPTSPSSSSSSSVSKPATESLYAGAPLGWRPLAPVNADSSNVILAASELLLFPMAWVRLAAARLLGLFLSRRDVAAIDAPAAFLASGRVLSALGLRMCNQLTSRHLGTRLAEQAAKNLTFVTLALSAIVPASQRNAISASVAQGHAVDIANAADAARADEIPRTNACADSSSRIPTSDEVNASAGDGKARALFDIGKRASNVTGANTAAAAGDDKIDSADDGADEFADDDTDEGDGRAKHDPVFSIIARACSIARFPVLGQDGDTARSAVLLFLSSVAQRLPSGELLRYLAPITRLILRLSTDGADSGAAPSAATASLAAEALTLFQKVAGPQAVLGALNAERARVAAVRLGRRRARATLAVTDPEAAAAEKQRRNQSKARGKKRRVEEVMLAKGSKRERRE